MTEERRLPRGPLIVCGCIVLAFIAMAVYCVSINKPERLAMAMFFLPVLALLYHALRRCPKCHGVMSDEIRPEGQHERKWLYCAKCNIRWDTGEVRYGD